MTMMSDIPKAADRTHLLLIGGTKLGKSTYVANAILAGMPCIYVDSDNGQSALRRAFEVDEKGRGEEAQKRVALFKTTSPYAFLKDLMESSVFRWNLTKDTKFSSYKANPEDQIVEIIPAKVPKEMLLVGDSWTTIALNALGVSAKDKSVTLDDLGAASQGIYGDAYHALTLLCAIQQQVPFHTVFLAHPTFYERLEKPAGVMGEIKQKDMLVKETIEIPASSSRPHGYMMGKYFTDIGWLEIDRANRVMLDFTIKHGRVGGGTVNKRDVVANLSWTKCFSKPPEDPASLFNPSWIRYMTAAEFAERSANKDAGAKAGATPASPLSKTPVQPKVNPLMAAAKAAASSK